MDEPEVVDLDLDARRGFFFSRFDTFLVPGWATGCFANDSGDLQCVRPERTPYAQEDYVRVVSGEIVGAVEGSVGGQSMIILGAADQCLELVGGSWFFRSCTNPSTERRFVVRHPAGSLLLVHADVAWLWSGTGNIIRISADESVPLVSTQLSLSVLVHLALAGDWLLASSGSYNIWLNAQTLEPRAPWIHE